MLRLLLVPLCSLVLALVGLLGAPDAQAQSSWARQAPAAGQAVPEGGGAVSSRAGRSNPTGTSLPSYAEPSAPSLRHPSGKTSAPGGRIRTNDGPNMPTNPDQVPLGGTEWLAAAGAAYALNRLRKNKDDEGSEDA